MLLFQYVLLFNFANLSNVQIFQWDGALIAYFKAIFAYEGVAEEYRLAPSL